MNIDINEIYTFKLVTGEELVAKVTQHTNSTLEVEQPISTVISPQGLQMMPSLFSADTSKKVQINTNTLVMVAQPRDDVRNSYIQATTGIAPVTKQIITG